MSIATEDEDFEESESNFNNKEFNQFFIEYLSFLLLYYKFQLNHYIHYNSSESSTIRPEDIPFEKH